MDYFFNFYNIKIETDNNAITIKIETAKRDNNL